MMVGLRLFWSLAMKPYPGFAEFLSSHTQGGMISWLFQHLKQLFQGH